MMRAVTDPWVSDFQGGNGMSQRWLFIGLVCLAWSWASSVNSVNAQAVAKPAKTDKMVRVTYPVADLIVPILGYPCSDKKETLEATLIQVLTNTIARDSWNQAGGAGTIEYFPLGMAIVVNQRQGVHAEIARLLAELRRAQDVQVSIDMRAVHVSASMAKHLLLDMDDHGRPVRAIKEAGKESAPRFVYMDDKQIAALLKLAHSDEASAITRAPKVTLFNGQQGRLSCTRSGAGASKSEIMDGFQYDVLPVVDPEKKFVRMTLNLQHYTPKRNARAHVTKADDTFVMAPGRTLVWHLGATTEHQHLFVLATPRVVVVEEEERIFVGELAPIPGGAAEEQSAPAPKTAVSVDVETRFVHMSANTAKQWRKTLAQPGKNVALGESAKSGALVSVDDARLFMLLEAVQGDRTATINQYPKLTLLNNQAGECKEHNSTGWCAAFHPVVSADRRSVNLKVNLEHRTRDEAKSIERITKAAKTIVLPNGSTFVWDLGETAERHQLFVLVTPRIRVREEERIFLGEDAPIPGR
jgi:hypothetical protein